MRSTTICQSHNKRGQPCQNGAGPDGFCWWHSPQHAPARAAARSKGGKARHGRVIGPTPHDGSADDVITIASADDVLRLVNRAIADALHCERSLNRARVLGSLAEIALKVFSSVELEARIVALESQIAPGVNAERNRNGYH